jgi:hypothetical protein
LGVRKRQQRQNKKTGNCYNNSRSLRDDKQRTATTATDGNHDNDSGGGGNTRSYGMTNKERAKAMRSTGL